MKLSELEKIKEFYKHHLPDFEKKYDDFLINGRGKNTEVFFVENVFELMENVVKKACKKQRENCDNIAFEHEGCRFDFDKYASQPKIEEL